MFEIFLRKGKDKVTCYKTFHEVRQKNKNKNTTDIKDLEDNRTLIGMKTNQNPHTTVSCILHGSKSDEACSELGTKKIN